MLQQGETRMVPTERQQKAFSHPHQLSSNLTVIGVYLVITVNSVIITLIFFFLLKVYWEGKAGEEMALERSHNDGRQENHICTSAIFCFGFSKCVCVCKIKLKTLTSVTF